MQNSADKSDAGLFVVKVEPGTSGEKSVSSKHYICEQCDHAFTSRAQLNFHNDIVHLTDFSCGQCKCVFGTADRLKEHQHSAHKVIAMFPCELCDRAFSMVEYLELHIQTNHMESNCSECDSNLKWKAHGKVKHFCDHCSKAYTTQINLEYHVDAAHKEMFTCNYCNTICLTKAHLINHIHSLHSQMYKLAKPKVFMCHECDREFPSELYFGRHLSSVHQSRGKKMCHICKLVFRSHVKLREHLEAHAHPHKCP